MGLKYSGAVIAEVIGPDILIVFGFLLIPVLLGIWVAVDAGGKPDVAFERAGTSKTLWIVLPIVGIFICVMSVIVAIMWFAAIRPKVVAAAAQQ
jgi:hypothetical protein